MRKFLHSRLLLIPSVLLLMAALVGLAQGYSALHPASARAASTHKAIDCSQTRTCADARVEDETYVGHDEPSVLFYSNKPGSGTRMQYHLSLPKDPPAQPTQADGTVSTNFQLHPAFWFGMAMCATQSAPNPGLPCTPDSDNNITDAAHHPGAAFTELQFYPPGWVQWPNIAGSCDPTRWCAALNIDSVAVDQIHGTTLNIPCAQFIFAPTFEYVNFAFVTKNGHSLAPANPVDSTLATFTPDAARTLFMNSGDQLVVTLRDSEHGLRVEITDLTTHQSGLMTASAENGFGQVKYAPAPSTECTNIPYDFHPMYSTTSEQTDVPWTVHSYNIAFSDEIGHWDYCSSVPQDGGSCAGNEGAGSDQEPADEDNTFCFSQAPAGCVDSNTGFDGVSYQQVWPDGDTAHHPTPILFTSPLTGDGFNVNYNRVAFETDLPDLEGTCNIFTGAGCTLIPTTDDGAPAGFYPFFSMGRLGEHCYWGEGNDIPGFTQNDFGRNNQYGTLLARTHINFGGGGTTRVLFVDFRQILSSNPCLAPGASGGR